MMSIYGRNEGILSFPLKWPRPHKLFVPVSLVMDDIKSPITSELMTDQVEQSIGSKPCQRVAPLPENNLGLKHSRVVRMCVGAAGIDPPAPQHSFTSLMNFLLKGKEGRGVQRQRNKSHQYRTTFNMWPPPCSSVTSNRHGITLTPYGVGQRISWRSLRDNTSVRP